MHARESRAKNGHHIVHRLLENRETKKQYDKYLSHVSPIVGVRMLRTKHHTRIRTLSDRSTLKCQQPLLRSEDMQTASNLL